MQNQHEAWLLSTEGTHPVLGGPCLQPRPWSEPRLRHIHQSPEPAGSRVLCRGPLDREHLETGCGRESTEMGPRDRPTPETAGCSPTELSVRTGPSVQPGSSSAGAPVSHTRPYQGGGTPRWASEPGGCVGLGGRVSPAGRDGVRGLPRPSVPCPGVRVRWSR